MLLFYKANFQLIKRIEIENKRQKSDYESLQNDTFINSRDYQEETLQRNLEYLVYQLQNPNPKVGISYSIVANKTYPFLPEALTARGTQTEHFKKAKQGAQKKLNELIMLANTNGATIDYLSDTNSIKFTKGSISATLSIDVYMIGSPAIFWVLLNLDHPDAKWTDDIIIRFNNMIGYYLNANKGTEELAYYYFIILELFLFHETNVKLLTRVKNLKSLSLRVFNDVNKDWYIDLSHIFPKSRFKLQLLTTKELTVENLENVDLSELYRNNLGSFECLRFKCFFGVQKLKDKYLPIPDDGAIVMTDKSDLNTYTYSSKRLEILRPQESENVEKSVYSALSLTIATRLFKVLCESIYGSRKPELHLLSSVKHIEDSDMANWLSNIKRDNLMIHLTIESTCRLFISIDVNNSKESKKIIKFWYSIRNKSVEEQQEAERYKKELHSFILNGL